MFPLSRIITTLFILLAMLSAAMPSWAEDQNSAVNPLRLSYINGSVSFWRYGADDWVQARINTPLMAGDSIYTGKNSELELQAEGRAFIRSDDNTQLSIVNQTPDYLQLKVTTGRVSLDLRTLPSAGYTVELDTPNAVFTIDHIGYYRVDVDGDVHFITRRGGRATMTPLGSEAMTLLPSEETVIHQGTDMARAETYAAPELDEWDQWNYDRTNSLVDAVSERYLSAGIAGAHDLDYYGNWRVSDEYGPVWVPDGIGPDWAPYTTGRWIWDSNYQWTWVDDAPWGWAPFHYGRWVYFGGYWAWAPGPVVLRRPVYAPALVAFFGNRSGLSVGVGGLGLGWVALGWGEPLIPWWGRSGFVGRAYWGGWGGPRVVNNVVVRQGSTVNINNISYANRHVSNAFVTTTQDQFGREHGASNRPQGQDRDMDHIHGALPFKPNSANLVGDAPKGVRPPEQVISRQVVATRPPQGAKLPWQSKTANPKAAEPRYVPIPKPSDTELRRPEVGTDTGPERIRPQLPRPYRQAEPGLHSSAGRTESTPTRKVPPQPTTPAPSAMPAQVQTPVPTERQQHMPRTNEAAQLPNRVSPPPVTATLPREVHQAQPPSPIAVSTPAPIAAPAPAQAPVPSQVRQPIQAAPQSHVQAAQQPRTQVAPQAAQPQIAQPQGSHQDLPGKPANRTFRKGDQANSERWPQQH